VTTAPDVFADTARSLRLRDVVPMRVTDKSAVAAASRDGQPVILKVLTTDDEYWRRHWQHEIAIYRQMAACLPPVPVPRLLHADAHAMLLQRLAGRPLHTNRHAPRLPVLHLAAALDTLTRFATWAPPGALPMPSWTYPQRIARYHAAGYLTDNDAKLMASLAHRHAGQETVCHGDPLPSNILLHGDRCALIDFEHTTRRLPGWDLAVTHLTLAGHNPGAVTLIAGLVNAHDISGPFALNLALAAARELRLHAETGSTRAPRPEYLYGVMAHARSLLNQV
jgi:Ser/Thr protein kinase RdoA (MazF antagonist)